MSASEGATPQKRPDRPKTKCQQNIVTDSGYGSFPTEEFTMLGIITSVPLNEEETFTPLQEFDKEVLADYESVESAFRGIFRGFDGMEAMVRTCRYPRVLVHPVLVYRQSSPNKSLQRTSL